MIALRKLLSRFRPAPFCRIRLDVYTPGSRRAVIILQMPK